MKNYLVGFSFLSLIYGVSACTNNTNKAVEPSEVKKETIQSATPKFADEKMNEVYQHYIHLKTALVNDDAKEADMSAKMLEKALTDAKMTKEAALATDLAKSTDVKSKREKLNGLSLALVDAFKKSKIESGVVYKQYCPMANDGNGGYWLASEKQVKNPYYGASMLTCGSVEEEIK